MLNLHRPQMTGLSTFSKNIITFLLVAFFGICTFIPNLDAQPTSRGNTNYLDFQAKPYYFGITLGYNSSNFRVYHSKQFILNDSFARAESINGPGFNLGIVSNLKIGENFDIRFLPTLSFGEKQIRYALVGKDAKTKTRSIESVFVELPFQARYKSAPYHDFRLFIIGGFKYSFDVASDSRTRQAGGIVKVAPTDFQIEYGAGIQFFFPYFIFSPEIKISQGLNNILIFNDSVQQSTIIEKVLSRAFTFSLHFEG
jgi:Outer membrane protein beta-barrel domain